MSSLHQPASTVTGPMSDSLPTGVRLARVSAEPLNLLSCLELVSSSANGAITSFLGVVRDHDPEAERRVVTLEYSAHPLAEKFLNATLTRVIEQVDPQGIALVALAHAVGSLAVGDAALVCAVGSPHRRLSMDLCSAIVEAIKAELPVWKRQVEDDGTAVWSQLGVHP